MKARAPGKTVPMVAFSPLSQTIMAGRTKPGSGAWSGEKHDVTPFALEAAALLVVAHGGTFTVTAPDGTPYYEIKARDLQAEARAKAAPKAEQGAGETPGE